MTWLRANSTLHRYLGFFFFGTTLIYGISGIALNHIDDWDPSYIVLKTDIAVQREGGLEALDEAAVRELFASFMGRYDYKSHYYPNDQTLKVFYRLGSITVDTRSGAGIRERLVRKPLFFGVNFLHYNPIRYWTYFADLYAVALILLAISGLVIRKRDNGVAGLGGWLTLIGAIIPFLYIAFLVDFSNF